MNPTNYGVSINSDSLDNRGQIAGGSDSTSHYEVHNMSEQKSGDTYQGQFGIGHMSGGEVTGDATVAGVINEAQQQNLSEAVAEVQQILQHLSQTYPTETVTEQMVVATEAIKKIEAHPTLKQRLINAGKEGGLAAIEKTLNNPVAAFLVNAVKGWMAEG